MSASAATSDIGSKLKDTFTTANIVIVISSTIFISLFITAFVRMSQFLGSKDDWNDLKPKVLEVSLYTIFGTIAFGVASIIFMVQNPSKAIYFSMIVSTIALGLAFASLAVASISR